MSTFDRAFIRAYAKEADLRGVAEPDVYAPPQVEERQAAPGPASTHSTIAGWPSDRLYAEGAWYRIERRQDNAPVPHLPASWFSSPRTASPPSYPNSARVAPASEEEEVRSAPSPDSDEEPVRRPPDASSPELEAVGRLDFTSQYMISATVNYPYSYPGPLPSQASPSQASPEGPQPIVGDDQPDDRAGPVDEGAVADAADPGVNTDNHTDNDAQDNRATVEIEAVERPAAIESSPPAPPIAKGPQEEPRAQGIAAAEPTNSDDDDKTERDVPDTSRRESEAAISERAAAAPEPARLDASLHEIPTPHFPMAGSKSPQVGGAMRSESPETPSQEERANRSLPAATTNTQPATPLRQLPAAVLNPAWEVDAFAWPELTDRLLRRESVRFARLAGKLATAAREGRNVVAVTSPARQQGRSTLSLCLARRLAADGQRVALVDADFDNPQLAQRLRLNPTCGWQDAIGTDLSLEEAAVMSLRDAVTLFPLRVSGVQRVDDAIDVSDMADVIDRLSRSFDLVILDMEPVEPLDEAPPQSATLHPAVTGLLVYNAQSSRGQLAETVLQLRAVGIEAIGAVENQATISEEV
jgi:Mrp family chromosome partitioning ATPase